MAATGARYPKDGINDRIVHGKDTVNPAREGTKAACVCQRSVRPGESFTVTLRLTDDAAARDLGADVDVVFTDRLREADAFYATRIASDLGSDCVAITRQAFAGMLWSKQFFHYVVEDWLDGDEATPPPERQHGRNKDWRHFYSEDILSMPDKWEYPWFASWDLCFHTVALARLDLRFAKEQVASADARMVYEAGRAGPCLRMGVRRRQSAAASLGRAQDCGIRAQDHVARVTTSSSRRVFNHSLLYFTWWVNRKDAEGNNLFQGGFLGLDNISAFDRSSGYLPGGGRLYQSDGTTWVGFFALQMMELASELSKDKPAYLDFAAKFFQHFVYVANALDHVGRASNGQATLWSDEEGLYFDVLHVGDSFTPIKIRSLVSILPMIAVASLDLNSVAQADNRLFVERIAGFRTQQRELLERATEEDEGKTGRLLLSFLEPKCLSRLLGAAR